ncbi:MAG: hypothetical protein HYX92_16615 [Chloroflexi bacterium]|nr:hypothetical protein [Chloroflexota bacterium]
MFDVFDPTQGPKTKRGELAARYATLDGLTLGVIWNGRPVGNEILARVLEAIRGKYQIREVVFRKKTFIGQRAPDDMLEEMARRCQVVIAGVGD